MSDKKMNSEPTYPSLLKYDVRDGNVRRRWVSTWYADGRRHSKTFGFEDDVTAKQLRRDYDAWMMQWRERPDLRKPHGIEAQVTATRLAARYLRHASRTFRKNGKPTSHVWNVKYAMRALRDRFGSRPATAIEAPDIAKLREGMIVGADGPRSLKTVNTRLRIVKDAFVWARERGWISKESLSDVLTVKRLRMGRTAAKNPKKIMGVSEAIVAPTLAVMPEMLRDMVELQRLTGMRPGEACIMRTCDIDTTTFPDVWIYKPAFFKTDHMEDAGERVVCMGRQCQEIVKKYMRPDLTAYLFSPAAAQAQRLAAKRAARKTPMYPSHAALRKENASGRLGNVYTTGAYRNAIHHACRKAGVQEWNPNQLRHARATELEKKYGLDGSRVVLGHKHGSTTTIYLDPDVQKAVQIAREVG